MSATVGIVIPTFRPNVDTLDAYATAIAETVGPDVIRIELDDPSPETESGVVSLEEESVDGTTVTVNAVDERRGKGAAITAGFESLDTDVLAFVDDDGSTLVPSLDRVIDAVGSGDTDVAVAARYHDDSWVHESTHRHLNGRLFSWTSRQLLPVELSDYQCGAKAISRSAWAGVRDQLREPGFAWDLEFLSMAHTLGYEVDEVPVSWVHNPRSRAESLSTAVELLEALVTVRHRTKRMGGDAFHELIGTRTETRRPLIEPTRPLAHDD